MNDFLRLGLTARKEMKAAKPFQVRARPMGLRPGFSLDSMSKLIEQVEGPWHR